jgi:FdhD protein
VLEKPEAAPGVVATGYRVLQGTEWIDLPSGEVIEEAELCIHVNGRELVTFAATPVQQAALALGFLANQGLIERREEVRDLHLSTDGLCVDVWLDHEVPLPDRLVITSGCSGGVTFDRLVQKLPPLSGAPTISAETLLSCASRLQRAATLYSRSGGVHTSALFRDGELLVASEDVGRHNTLDKLRGLCLLRGIDPSGAWLLTTGRTSSEMITKAVRMGCPVLASRTSATSLSVRLAREWNAVLVGYVRSPGASPHGQRMIVYSHPERIVLGPAAS